MRFRNRIKKIEEKLGINSEDEEFFNYYATLENPSREMQMRHFTLCVKKIGLESIVIAAHKRIAMEREQKK